MKRDDNDGIFTAEIIPKGIHITNLPLNFKIKQIYFLFSKAGDIESIFQNEELNALIIIFLRKSSVELALIYNNFKLGVSENEIKVQQLKDVEASNFENWKEIKEFNRKDLKPIPQNLLEYTSLRSSIISQKSFNDSFELTHEKMVKRISGMIKVEQTAKIVDSQKPLRLLKKHEDPTKACLSVIKEDTIPSEKNSPNVGIKFLFNRTYSNKENEFSFRLNKIQNSTENIALSSLEKKNSSSENLSLINSRLHSSSGSIKKTFISIQEEHLDKSSWMKFYRRSNEDVHLPSKNEEEIRESVNFNEPVEQTFQPLRNFKTSIGIYYKYDDLVRDWVLNLNYLGNIFKVWILLYIVNFVYEKIL